MTLTTQHTRNHGHVAGDPGSELRALRARVDGRIVLPGDPDWEDSRQARNLAETLRRIAPESGDALTDLRAVLNDPTTELGAALAAGNSFAGRVSTPANLMPVGVR